MHSEMSTIDPRAFEYAIEKIDDGFVFEAFALAFLSALNGWEFIPVGGSGDKGVDGYQHVFHRKGKEKTIVQTSTEKDTPGKIRETLGKLKKNKKACDRFVYVTNRKVTNGDSLIDEIEAEYEGVQVSIHDIKWFVARCAENAGVIAAYHTFVDAICTSIANRASMSQWPIWTKTAVFMSS